MNKHKMEEVKEEIEKRESENDKKKYFNNNQEKSSIIVKSRLKKILKDKYLIIFLIIFLIALIIRLYFFFQVGNQPLWWDEADYANSARWLSGNSIDRYGFPGKRPIFLSFLFAIPQFLGITSELIPRIIELLFSLGAIILIYVVGSKMFNKRVGLISSVFLSFFGLHIFYTYRLLLDVPTMFFSLLSLFFFWKWWKENKNKHLYLCALFTGIGILLHFFIAFLILAYLIFVLIVDRKRLLKKQSLIALGIGTLTLLPYLIWMWITMKNPLKSFLVYSQGGGYIEGYEYGILGYFKSFPSWFVPNSGFFSYIFLGLLIAGIIFIIVRFIIAADLIVKNKDKNYNPMLLLFLIFLIFLFLLTYKWIGHVEDRYFFAVFPAMFILFSYAFDKLYLFIKKYQKILAAILIIVLLVAYIVLQMKAGTNLIDVKKESYLPVKEAGLWLKENTPEDSKIVTRSYPHTFYYANRPVFTISDSQEEFETMLEKEKPDYLMLSVFEPHPQWAYNWPDLNPDKAKLVKYWLSGQGENAQPLVIIYELSF